MIETTEYLLSTAPLFDAVLAVAVDEFQSMSAAQFRRAKPSADYAVMADVRAAHGFARRAADLLTAPLSNVKLAKGEVPAYGFTGHHFRVVLEARDRFPRLVLNSCPNAGHCTRVCVLNEGNGRYESTPRAWAWRMDLLTRHPYSFARILAYELVRAVRRHGRILFRPNVNTDIGWEDVLPSLANGHVAGVLSYGYSKRPQTLAADGWLGSHYKVAYSWHESADVDAVRAFRSRGGAVAVVTERKRGAAVLDAFPFGVVDAVDADVSDEWMLVDGAVVGDLSAKGKARQLIGKSAFVVTRAAVARGALTVRAA